MKYLGIDYGTKRIGLALSNEEGTLAFPKTILQNNDSTIKELQKIIEEELIGALVIGKSVQADGTENSLMKEIRRFVEKLDLPEDFPIELEDERFSSIAAQAHLYTKGNIANPKWSGKENAKKREHNDAHAAVIILQRFLERKSNL